MTTWHNHPVAAEENNLSRRVRVEKEKRAKAAESQADLHIIRRITFAHMEEFLEIYIHVDLDLCRCQHVLLSRWTVFL